ncbi:hypothetical protein AFLA_012889, partial [Aspergillus flavus NRRL3357]
MSSTINTSKGEQPIDPYKAKSLEDPPLAQKVEDLVDFISEAKFGMLTTKIAGSEYLTSRCMALAGEEVDVEEKVDAAVFLFKISQF